MAIVAIGQGTTKRPRSNAQADELASPTTGIQVHRTRRIACDTPNPGRTRWYRVGVRVDRRGNARCHRAFTGLLIGWSITFTGCTIGSSAPVPSSTTQPAFTHAQVLGWITPTLDNGSSFLGTLPTDVAAEQIFDDSRPLAVATSVSLHELAEVSWTGRLDLPERRLRVTLERIEDLTSTPPGPGYRNDLGADTQQAQSALTSLKRSVGG
jgi:hypothetical protein